MDRIRVVMSFFLILLFSISIFANDQKCAILEYDTSGGGFGVFIGPSSAKRFSEMKKIGSSNNFHSALLIAKKNHSIGKCDFPLLTPNANECGILEYRTGKFGAFIGPKTAKNYLAMYTLDNDLSNYEDAESVIEHYRSLGLCN